MNPKTKEAIAVEIVRYGDSKVGITEALDKICAIVEAEGEGEVVILDGMIPFRDFDVKINHLCGKKGRIIFQPEGESK